MDIHYFRSAWGDVSNSPGWIGKIALLALLALVPVFGQIVLFGYLYYWAREIAWCIHEPMPRRIFQCDGASFWRRGWFIFVLTFVFLLIPIVCIHGGLTLENATLSYSSFNGLRIISKASYAGMGILILVIGIILAVISLMISGIGNMRIAIYNRLSSGFQLRAIIKMFKHDKKGIAKISAMLILLSIIYLLIVTIIASIAFFVIFAIGFAGLFNPGYSLEYLPYYADLISSPVAMPLVLSTGFIGFSCIVFVLYCASFGFVLIAFLITRSLGYWVMQFDVNHWGGQDEPLPFEVLADLPQNKK